MRIGVIGMQGAISEHMDIIEALGHSAVWVKKKEQARDVCGVIIPGGESTTISKLMERTGLLTEVRKLALEGMPVYGTCAGLILIAKKGDSQVSRTKQKLLGLMDIEVRRNAFGRQRESFERDLDVGGIEGFPCVFIRAPAVRRVWGKCKALAKVGEQVVAVEQDSLFGTAFHPELTEDTRIHEYFISKI